MKIKPNLSWFHSSDWGWNWNWQVIRNTKLERRRTDRENRTTSNSRNRMGKFIRICVWIFDEYSGPCYIINGRCFEFHHGLRQIQWWQNTDRFTGDFEFSSNSRLAYQFKFIFLKKHHETTGKDGRNFLECEDCRSW